MIYLDNAATTAVAPEVVAAMMPALHDQFANPSSRHRLGVKVRGLVEDSRARIAEICGIAPQGVVFTSGGTEANNLAVQGFHLHAGATRMLSTAVEHPSLLRPLQSRTGFEWQFVGLTAAGQLDLGSLEEKLGPDVGMVASFEGHNEIGSINPVASVVSLVRQRAPRAIVHLDCVQSFGKLASLRAHQGVTSRAISGHKFHGPKGIGALLISEPRQLIPHLLGGGQEGDLRSGTENVPGILGLCRAIELLHEKEDEACARMRGLRDHLLRGLRASVPDLRIVGDPDQGLPHLVTVVFHGLLAAPLLHHLEQHEIYASAGAACHSHGKSPSSPLAHYGLSEDELRSTVRFSLSRDTASHDVEKVLELLPAIAGKLRRLGARA